MDVGGAGVVIDLLNSLFAFKGIELFLQRVRVNLNMDFLTVDFESVQQVHCFLGFLGARKLD